VPISLVVVGGVKLAYVAFEIAFQLVVDAVLFENHCTAAPVVPPLYPAVKGATVAPTHTAMSAAAAMMDGASFTITSAAALMLEHPELLCVTVQK
jgi:hypothetical protein